MYTDPNFFGDIIRKDLEVVLRIFGSQVIIFVGIHLVPSSLHSSPNNSNPEKESSYSGSYIGMCLAKSLVRLGSVLFQGVISRALK